MRIKEIIKTLEKVCQQLKFDLWLNIVESLKTKLKDQFIAFNSKAEDCPWVFNFR